MVIEGEVVMSPFATQTQCEVVSVASPNVLSGSMLNGMVWMVRFCKATETCQHHPHQASGWISIPLDSISALTPSRPENGAA